MPNQNTYKTHCKRGHLLIPENITEYGKRVGKRVCRICKNIRQKQISETPENKAYRSNWQRENPERVSVYNKNWREENPNYSRDWDARNPEKRKAIHKKHNGTPHRKTYKKNYNKLHPYSNKKYPPKLRYAMNKIRKQQNNTCQWFGCGKSVPDVSIHVHHIFPKKEYPELMYKPWNMICYCVDHHIEFHDKRGDTNTVILLKAQKEYEENERE